MFAFFVDVSSKLVAVRAIPRHYKKPIRTEQQEIKQTTSSRDIRDSVSASCRWAALPAPEGRELIYLLLPDVELSDS
jgi:hypothetical protein